MPFFSDAGLPIDRPVLHARRGRNFTRGNSPLQTEILSANRMPIEVNSGEKFNVLRFERLQFET
jgi:hypothetical protein